MLAFQVGAEPLSVVLKSRGKSSVFSPHMKLGPPGCRLVLEGGTLAGDSENDLPNHPEKCLSNERRGRTEQRAPPDRSRWRGKEKGPAQALSQGARRQGEGQHKRRVPGTGAAAGEPGSAPPAPSF